MNKGLHEIDIDTSLDLVIEQAGADCIIHLSLKLVVYQVAV